MSRRRPKYGPLKVREAIRCVFCGAARGELCWNNHVGRQIRGVHWQRRKDYERQIGDRPELRGKVDVYFVCPVCEGPHRRRDCPDLTDAPSRG